MKLLLASDNSLDKAVKVIVYLNLNICLFEDWFK